MAPNQPFQVDVDCSPEIQEAVGLRKAMCETPRVGDKTRPGEHNYNQNSSWCIQDSFTTEGASTLWGMVSPEKKNAPADKHEAYQLALLAKNANKKPSSAVRKLVPDCEKKGFGTTFYIAPGSGLFEGFRASHKFIAFLFANMDDNACEKWYNMTGREQYEWYRAWERAGRTHLRTPDKTIGLRGTDLNRIKTQADLNNAMIFSPSLGRRNRPTGHAVTQDEWDDIRKRLYD